LIKIIFTLVLLSLSSSALVVSASVALAFRFVHAAEGYVLLHGSPEAWVTESIDHWVVGGARFGQKSGEHGHQGGDHRLIEEQSLDGDSAIRSPAQDPETDVEDGDLSNTHLGALSLSARSEAGNVHLLGLSPHGRFVSSDGLDDEEVGVEDAGKRHNVAPDEDEDSVGPVVEVLGQVVGGAGVKDTFWDVGAPSEERCKGGDNGINPDEGNHGHGLGEAKGCARDSVDDDVVTVVGDEDQRPDGSETSHKSTESINFTSESREHPDSTTERVVCEDWEVAQQHVQVKNSKVGNQQVGGSPQLLDFEVKIDYHAVTQEGGDPEEAVDHSEEIVPHGVHWGVVVPVRVDHVFDLG